MLTSRSGILDPVELTQFAALGVVVYSIKSDSADARASSTMIEWAHETLYAIKCYVHAAGVSNYALLQDVSDDVFNDTCNPKVCLS